MGMPKDKGVSAGQGVPSSAAHQRDRFHAPPTSCYALSTSPGRSCGAIVSTERPNKEPRYSLHPLRPHDLHHLPRSHLVEARARVAVADVRLNVEGLRGHAGLDLVVERRQGRVRVRAREYRQRAHALWHEGREA